MYNNPQTTPPAPRLIQYNFTEWLGALCPAAEGKLLVVGNSAQEDGKFTLARLLPDGELDTSFNESGLIEHAFDEQAIFYALSVHLEPSNAQEHAKIFISGVLFAEQGIYPAAARCLASGSLDDSFADQGLFIFNDSRYTASPANYKAASCRQRIASLGMMGAGAATLADGGYLLSPAETGLVLKLTSAGTLDTSFAKDGVLEPSNFEATSAIVLGKRLYLTGQHRQGGTVAAYTPQGELDESFGEGGMVNIATKLLALAPGEDGQSLNVVGVTDTDGNNRGCLARLKTNGSLLLKPVVIAPANREADLRYVMSRTDQSAQQRIYGLGQTTEQNRDARYYIASRHADGTVADDFPGGLVVAQVNSTVLGCDLVGSNELALCGYVGSQGFVAWYPLAE